MSRYVLLVLLTMPFIFLGIMSSVVSYKLGRIQLRRLVLRVGFWLTILIGLVFAEPIYNYLFSRGLTQTEPLSLFDVIQITAIVALLYTTNRIHSKLEITERRLQDLHQELSIRLSKD